jgi:plasmid stability protein
LLSTWLAATLTETVKLWYRDRMKNITVSVPDDVYRNARIRAAERGTSVSALVAEHLRSLSGRDAEFSRLEAQQKRIQSQITRFRARDRLDRDQLHGRAVR